jgi:DNA repair exonuclease SbcCD ATPase subunit
MEQQETRNAQPDQPNDIGKRVHQLSVETARAQESADHAAAQAEHIRFDLEELKGARQSHGRGLAGLWGFCAVLALAVGGLAWYGIDAARGHDDRFASLPNYEQAIQALNAQVNERMEAAESKLASWAGDWKGMGDRLTKVEQRVTSDVKLVRSFAQQQANEVHRQLITEIDNRTEWVQTHMSRMESTQESQRARIAELQEELAGVRAELKEQNEQIEMVRRDANREMDGLHERVAATRGDLDALARESAKDRVEFELSRGEASEPIPGVTITLKNTNVSYQRVEEGWVHVVADGRILWIRSQGVQQPMTFYMQQDSRPYQLVFTRITRDGAVGYLVHPGGPPVANRASGPLPAEAELSASAAEAR